jgi:hypothetical protein
MSSWENTRKIYIEWLQNNNLRIEFSKKIKLENLSLWWLTDLINKDNINEQIWFENLNKKISGITIKKESNYKYYFLLFLKLFKKLLVKIILTIFIKIFFRDKINGTYKNSNCFYGLLSNFVEFKGAYIDRQYGLCPFKKKISQIYCIEFVENFSSIFNYYKIKKKLLKVPCDYFILNNYIDIWDIIRIYIFTFKKLLEVLIILSKNKYFLLAGVNCEDIFKKKLISSFFGSIQNELINGYALRKGLKKADPKNFINCFDFHPRARSIYYFSYSKRIKNIISINHANYSKNNLFFNFMKSEFRKDNKNDCTLYSPQPNIFFCQGERYFKKIRSVFTNNKVYKIGSFKIELDNKKFISKKIIKKERFNDNKKKKLLILCSLNDYNSFIKLLNLCNLEKFLIILMPHPLKRKQTIIDFHNKLNKKFIISNNKNRDKFIKSSDYIISGDSSLAIGLAILKYNVIRVYDKEFIPTFDIDKEIPTATNHIVLDRFLRMKSIKQNSLTLEKNYFYKYDNKTSSRFERIINSL